MHERNISGIGHNIWLLVGLQQVRRFGQMHCSIDKQRVRCVSYITNTVHNISRQTRIQLQVEKSASLRKLNATSGRRSKQKQKRVVLVAILEY